METHPKKCNFIDIQNAIDNLSLKNQNNFSNLINIIISGEYGPDYVQNLSITIHKLKEIISDCENQSEQILAQANNYEIQNETESVENLEEKVKSIIDLVIYLESRKIGIQREAILTPYYDLNSGSLKIGLDDEESIQNSINQLFEIFEASEELSNECLQKVEYYKNKGNFSFVKSYLKYSIEIQSYQDFNAGNICFFQIINSEIQVLKIIQNVPQIAMIFPSSNFEIFARVLLVNIANAKLTKKSIQNLNESIEKIELLLNNYKQKLIVLNNKEIECVSKNNRKLGDHYKLIIKYLEMGKKFIEDADLELKEKFEKLNKM